MPGTPLLHLVAPEEVRHLRLISTVVQMYFSTRPFVLFCTFILENNHLIASHRIQISCGRFTARRFDRPRQDRHRLSNAAR